MTPKSDALVVDAVLLHEAQSLTAGDYGHELNRLRGMYEYAAQRQDGVNFALHGDSLRRLVAIIKRRRRAAPTCKHENMQSVKACGWTWLFCDECGHIADERKL